jgi:hypothetical protein
MRVIVHSAGLIGLAAILLHADAQTEVTALIASLTAALTEMNVPEFMAAFDKSMPDYERLKADIDALVNQAEISSSIEPIKNEGDERKRVADLDWYLEVRSLAQDGPIVRRRQLIHCELRKENKRWKIVSINPIEFFAPAKLDQ